MIYFIWFTFLLLGLLFFLISFKYKREYPIETHLLMIVGGFFILMSGLFVLTVGVDFPNGEYTRNYPACSLCGGNWTAVYQNVTDPLTNRTVEQFIGYEPSIGILTDNSSYATTYIASTDKITTYLTLQGGLRGSFGLSWALILLSFGLFLISFLSFREYLEGKKNSRIYSEDEY